MPYSKIKNTNSSIRTFEKSYMPQHTRKDFYQRKRLPLKLKPLPLPRVPSPVLASESMLRLPSSKTIFSMLKEILKGFPVPLCEIMCDYVEVVDDVFKLHKAKKILDKTEHVFSLLALTNNTFATKTQSSINIYDLDGKLQKNISGDFEPSELILLRPQTLATFQGTKILSWELDKEYAVKKFERASTLSLYMLSAICSLNNKYFVSIYNPDCVTLWDIENVKVLKEFFINRPELENRLARYRLARLSDFSFVSVAWVEHLVAIEHRVFIDIWNEKGQRLYFVEHRESYSHKLTISSVLGFFAICFWDRIIIYNKKCEPLKEIKKHGDCVKDIILLPSTNLLIRSGWYDIRYCGANNSVRTLKLPKEFKQFEMMQENGYLGVEQGWKKRPSIYRLTPCEE